MGLEARIDAIGDSIPLLVGRLHARKFQFDRPAEVFPGPEGCTPRVIARIEREIGVLPLALKLFWQRVGSIDLCRAHPEWGGCDYPDPLVVFPASVAIQELDEFLSDREERLRDDFPYLVPIAPDLYGKADASGGMWYNVSVPAVRRRSPAQRRMARDDARELPGTGGAMGGLPGAGELPMALLAGRSAHRRRAPSRGGLNEIIV